MKKRLPSILFVAVFFVICAVPTIGFFIFGPAEAGANERLAAKPTITERDGSFNTEFLADLSDYFAGRFFLRQEMITANNGITALLASSAEEDVILGKNGWLYYADTLGDYTGTEYLGNHDGFAARNNLSLMQQHCEAAGVDFLFTLAPNKNSLYYENMPDYGNREFWRQAQRLYSGCEVYGVNYLDLFEVFNAEDEVLYFAHDSHWNSRGAALAADAILAAFGKESNYFGGDFSKETAHKGDLFEMLYPAGTDKETDPVYSPAIELEYEGSGVRPDSINIVAHGGGEGTLLAYRDSFGNNLYPYLADSFETARFSRSTTYDLTKLEGVDCLLIELVERNIDYLATNIPLMPAPAATAVECETIEAEYEREEVKNAPEGCVLVRGTLDIEAVNVYILCEGAAYSAFLLQGGQFAAYIPAVAEILGIGALDLWNKFTYI